MLRCSNDALSARLAAPHADCEVEGADGNPGFARGSTVTGVEAGNVLVSLMAVDSNAQTANTYFQEMYALVGKDAPRTVKMGFAAGPNADDRYRIGYLGVGQSSQNDREPPPPSQQTSDREDLPLQQAVEFPAGSGKMVGKDAMVRVMAFDAWGDGGRFSDKNAKHRIEVTWQSPGGSGSKTFASHVSGYHTKSGHEDGSYASSSPGPVIPAAHVRPGLTVTAKLLKEQTSQVLCTKTIQPDVRNPRRILVKGYDVRPPGGSGVPLVRDETQMNEWVLPFVRSVFPYSVIDYKYCGKIWMPSVTAYFGGLGNIFMAKAMIHMNNMQGWHETSVDSETEVLYLAMINERYADTSKATGMAWYGYRGAALARIDDEYLGYNIVHEMMHCFGAEHAPSDGADYRIPVIDLHVNRVDANYPYGGGGMAGGWAYAHVDYKDHGGQARNVHHFLSEDSHTADNWTEAHWDVTSYTKEGGDDRRPHQKRMLSDYMAKKLVTPTSWNQPQLLQELDPPGVTLHPGTSIKVFGRASARTVEGNLAWKTAGLTRSAHDLLDLPDVEAAPLDYVIGTDPLNGDPDSPEPPIMIVTRFPRLKGVTVDE
jgi:hypothetical protein